MKRLLLPAISSGLQPLAVALFAAVLLSTAGAFDTEAVRFGPRVIYWLAISVISTLALQRLHRFLRNGFDALPSPGLRVFGWAILALPLNALAALACKLLFGGTPSFGGFLLLLPGMASILAALQLTLFSFEKPRGEQELRPEAPCHEPFVGTRPLFAQSLPLPLRDAAIHALKAEDHYVRVHTEHGQALVRMRMSDAVAMLDGEDGVKPHRSWWVARAAVGSLVRRGNRTVIRIPDGTEVSRNARAALGPLFTNLPGGVG